MNLRDFLTLGPIVGAMPNQLADGQLIDAVPLMQNFNYIASQVNTNVPPLTTGLAPIYIAPSSVTGSANAIVLTPSPAITSYVDGQSFIFIPRANNTGGVTVNISGLGARSISGPANALTGGELSTVLVAQIVFQAATNSFSLVSAVAMIPSAFVPVLAFGGASVGITYNTQQGYVVKTGPLVYFGVSIVLTSKGSSVGSATITGLPYPVGTAITQAIALPMLTFGVTFPSGYNIATVATQTITMSNMTTGGAQTALADTNFANNSQLQISGVYSAQ